MSGYKPTPKDLVDRLVLLFKDAGRDMFPITHEVQYITFERGLYAHIYVKPIRRLAALLTAEREVLVLFSSFEDQQPRTIEMAAKLIDASGGRLEHTIAIIVHSDPSGNQKLREWGRESSLSVIPLCVRDDIPRGPELEAVLFLEFFAHDSFDVSGPVSDDSRFYGRRGEAQDIARHLERGQIKTCLGIRKTGKTSIINRVIDELDASHNCLSIMIDCSRDAVWNMDAGQLLDAIAKAVHNANEASRDYAAIAPVTAACTVAGSVEHLVEAVRQADRPVVLFFDETDYITPGSPTTQAWRERFNPFWRNLRAAHQELARSASVLSIMLSGVSSKWFREEAIDGIENAALAFVPEDYLSPLQLAASTAMIKTLARTSGLIFTQASCEAVAECCSNIPFWIRKACSYVHRNIPVEGRPYALNEDEVLGLLDAFVDLEGAPIAQVAVSHLFRVYPELVEVVARCLSGEGATSQLPLIATLERYGVLVRNKGAWRISGRMMTEGLRLAIQQRAERGDGAKPQVAFATLDEWAEEIALCGARRNIIEKRLRGIVLNFLRYDSLRTKGGPPLSERVMRYVEEDRRNKLKHLSADEIMERLLWTDLTRLMEKEWELFQSMFGDKPTFVVHAKTLNERYDAHAKDADRLDLSHYRKSLDYFEERMARA